MPSTLGIVRLVAFLIIAAYVLFPEGHLGSIVVPAFFVFFAATVISMRKASQKFDLKGLKKLRDIFPRK
jgi:ABC-type Fe3+-siderophore transport system permease subunit